MYEEEREIEKPNKIVEIVEESLKFNKQNQKGEGLKILTPNQLLSRLPIPLAQLKAGNNSEKLKILGNYYILCTDRKSLQKKSIKVWLTLFKKHENNFYEY